MDRLFSFACFKCDVCLLLLVFGCSPRFLIVCVCLGVVLCCLFVFGCFFPHVLVFCLYGLSVSCFGCCLRLPCFPHVLLFACLFEKCVVFDVCFCSALFPHMLSVCLC